MSKKVRANIFLGLGAVCLVIFVLVGRVAVDAGWLAFVTGMFAGLSVVFNVTGLLLWRRLRPRAS